MTLENKTTYIVTEDEIVKVSYLFGCLENAIKEIIRNRQMSVVKYNNFDAKYNLYETIGEMTSQVPYECEYDIENENDCRCEDNQAEGVDLKTVF